MPSREGEEEEEEEGGMSLSERAQCVRSSAPGEFAVNLGQHFRVCLMIVSARVDGACDLPCIQPSLGFAHTRQL